LLAARAEKAVLRMIAAESANFVRLEMILSPSFVRRRHCDGTPDPRRRNVYDYHGEYEFPTAQHWAAPPAHPSV